MEQNSNSIDEPITGTPATPTPGSEESVHNPFTPYEIGGPQAAWSYEQLQPAEKVVADRGVEDDRSAVQTAYAADVARLALEAGANSAALQLGIDVPLAETGVVP